MSKTRRHDPRGRCLGADETTAGGRRVCRKCGNAVKRREFRDPEG